MKPDIEKIKASKTTKELLEFGIINIDKSSGPTSFTVSEFVKKSLKLRKTSHFGTLDPKVTGVLPVALNRACKLTGFFLGEDKEYVGIMRFHEKVSLSKLNEIISNKFLGKIKQTPPVKSRVKRQEREREILEFEILEEDSGNGKGKDFLFRVSCQGGTYIRKLIDDLGRELNIGAHMLELRRIRAGIFNEESEMKDCLDYPSVNLYDFEKAVEEYKKGDDKNLRRIIIPGEVVSSIFEVVFVKESSIKNLLTGKAIKFEDLVEDYKLEKDEKIAVFSESKEKKLIQRFIEIACVTNEGIFARPEFVLQDVKG